MSNILVSVIIPSFNHELYISQAIETVMNQTYRNIELIVIDDGSNDSSVLLLEKLQLQYGFILKTQENHGLAYTLNRGINLSNGQYISLCASDDYWKLDKIEKQIKYMEQNTNIPMCYGKAIVVDEFNNINKKETMIINKNLKGGSIFKDIILINIHLPVNYMYRASVFREIGAFDEDIFTEDFYMNLKISSRFEVGFVNEYLSYYRYLNNESKLKSMNIVNSHLTCINMYKGNRYYSKAIRRYHFRILNWFSGYRKYKLLAISSIIKAFDFDIIPALLKNILKLLIVWK